MQQNKALIIMCILQLSDTHSNRYLLKYLQPAWYYRSFGRLQSLRKLLIIRECKNLYGHGKSERQRWQARHQSMRLKR